MKSFKTQLIYALFFYYIMIIYLYNLIGENINYGRTNIKRADFRV